MRDERTGFREIDHTADWTIEVWAPDLAGLLGEAARGMYEMAGVAYGEGGEEQAHFEVHKPDRETLLVGFLSELLYLLQTKHLGFEAFDFEIEQGDGRQVSVQARGRPVERIDKEIKAVTWHGIEVEETGEGFVGRVTFDV